MIANRSESLRATLAQRGGLFYGVRRLADELEKLVLEACDNLTQDLQEIGSGVEEDLRRGVEGIAFLEYLIEVKRFYADLIALCGKEKTEGPPSRWPRAVEAIDRVEDLARRGETRTDELIRFLSRPRQPIDLAALDVQVRKADAEGLWTSLEDLTARGPH